MTHSNTSRKPKPYNIRWLIENITSFSVALLIVFMIRSSIIEAFKIPSGSMIPTLLIGDHIFVNKFAYGLKIPFSDWITGRPIYMMERDPPKRGDIIVFLFPKDESFYYIKRVVGIPGDTVEIRNKVLYINQKMIARDLMIGTDAENIFKTLDDPKYRSSHLDIYIEHLNENNHFIMLDKNGFLAENHDLITVPSDHLFVMGDNRDFSNDSRFWGFVPMKNVKGKALVIWLSFWFSFSGDQNAFRPGRIGTVVR